MIKNCHEFTLINTFFNRKILTDSKLHSANIGDDCALVSIPVGYRLAQSIDTLVEGVHFPCDCDPYLLGYRALATASSDLAAMGAIPHSFTLALTIPVSDDRWIHSFSDGLAKVANELSIALIGGDLTSGPLTVSIQVQGLLSEAQAMHRSNAKVGDCIYVSGTLGDAAGVLPYVLKEKDGVKDNEKKFLPYLYSRYFQPQARISLAQWLLANGATAALDISDGLLGDLKHILYASGVSALLYKKALPISQELINIVGEGYAQQLALTGGDDYELCFTWPKNKSLILPSDLQADSPVTCIGEVINKKHNFIYDADTNKAIEIHSYQHF